MMQEEERYLATLSDHVAQINDSLQGLGDRYNALRDNPKDRVALRESTRTIALTKQSIDAAKDLKRKYSIWASGQPAQQPRTKLKRDKLLAALDKGVHDFNEIIAKLTQLTEMEGVRVVQPTAASITTTSSSSREFSTLADRQECLQGIQNVSQELESTQHIFDELGSLVQRQAPHLDQLENSTANSKHYSQEAANELQKEYKRRQRRARQLWTVFVMIVCTLFLMLYLYVRAPQGSNIITPTTPEASIPPLQQQPALELSSSVSNPSLILRGTRTFSPQGEH